MTFHESCPFLNINMLFSLGLACKALSKRLLIAPVIENKDSSSTGSSDDTDLGDFGDDFPKLSCDVGTQTTLSFPAKLKR